MLKILNPNPPGRSGYCDGVSRRNFLQIGGLALGGLGLPGILRAEAEAGLRSGQRQHKAVIMIFLPGGPSHQDMFDLKSDAPAEVRGEFRPIETQVPGIQICEHFPLLAQRTQHLAIIRSMTHTNVDHTTATHYLLTGKPPLTFSDLRKDWPHIGAVLAKLGRGRDPLPPFVSMRPKLENDVPRFVEQSHGQFAGWLGPTWDPLTIDITGRIVLHL